MPTELDIALTCFGSCGLKETPTCSVENAGL